MSERLLGPGSGGEPHRSLVRAFVRANHPDVGGDPELFVAGLRRLREGRHDGTGGGGGTWWPRPDDPRLDAPVLVVVGKGPLALVGRARRRLRGTRRTVRIGRRGRAAGEGDSERKTPR
jgi:hypothetical protein